MLVTLDYSPAKHSKVRGLVPLFPLRLCAVNMSSYSVCKSLFCKIWFKDLASLLCELFYILMFAISNVCFVGTYTGHPDYRFFWRSIRVPVLTLALSCMRAARDQLQLLAAVRFWYHGLRIELALVIFLIGRSQDKVLVLLLQSKLTAAVLFLFNLWSFRFLLFTDILMWELWSETCNLHLERRL